MILKFLIFAAVGISCTALAALGLILSDRPNPSAATEMKGGLEFDSIVARGFDDVPETAPVRMSDGWNMPVRRYGANEGSKPLLILIHGSGWGGLQFNNLAHELSDVAYVVVPDLRGHGATPERRGDVDYIGQMEDDIAELIKVEQRNGQSVVLGGHSSGGGLVVRIAGGKHRDAFDRAILLAPFLKHNAPTTRQNSGGWANTLTRRIIGLSMLNTFGIKGLNHLTIIQFNMPQSLQTGKYGNLATLEYSYRLNTGYAPRSDYLGDIASLPEFALIVGSEDEAFFADKYEEVMSKVSGKGKYHILEDETHLSIVDAAQTSALVRAYLK